MPGGTFEQLDRTWGIQGEMEFPGYLEDRLLPGCQLVPGSWRGVLGNPGGPLQVIGPRVRWEVPVLRTDLGPCLVGAGAPSEMLVLPLSMKVAPPPPAALGTFCPEEGRPGPPTLSQADHRPRARRELEPGSNSWSHSRVLLGATAFVPRPPVQPVPRLHLAPPKCAAGDSVRQAVRGPPAGQTLTPPPGSPQGYPHSRSGTSLWDALRKARKGLLALAAT